MTFIIEDFISESIDPLEKQYDVGLLIFTRDLRVQDNYCLELAGKHCKNIIPIFRFTSKQVDAKKNSYFSHHAVKFMCESLDELYDSTNKKLSFLYDDLPDPDEFDVIFIAKDYTDYAINDREAELKKYCKKWNKNLVLVHNHVLEPPGNTMTGAGTGYSKFTPYYNSANSKYNPLIVDSKKYVKKFTKYKTKSIDYHTFYDVDVDNVYSGGRIEAKKILRNISDFKNYSKERDILSPKKTTGLSPYNKFGCVSIREVYMTVKITFNKNHDIIRQLWWREFYYGIAIHFPWTTQGKSLNRKYDKIKWSYNKEHLKKWKQGKTGYPIVDAGIRELITTGSMHNRARLITASFLIKDLHIDWREGEKFFAKNLVDYDPLVNNGNWQWVAGSGADSQPYFRIFNPDLQQKRFDPQEKYIDEWVSDSEIDEIVDHDVEKNKAIKYYKDAIA